MEIVEENGVKYELSEVKKGGKVIGTIKTPYYSPEELEGLSRENSEYLEQAGNEPQGYHGQEEGEQNETDNQSSGL